MLKKMICTVLTCAALLVGACAAGTVFPAAKTDIDGVTRFGYLSETGETSLPFVYAKAEEFAPCGLASVEDNNWQTAVIDRTGKLVVPYTESPVSVEFSDDMLAYRYADHSVYYTLEGERIGSYAGAVGFFSDGILLCKSPASGLYSYVKQNGSPAFEGEFQKAGAFSGGRALVRLDSGVYAAIDTTGNVLYELKESAEPAYMSIYQDDTIILYNGSAYALYSLAQQAYLTRFDYADFSEFEDGVAMVRYINRWGLIGTDGNYRTEPTYYYLSCMGDGLYAARSEDGSASAVDADGNTAYRTLSYVGGFAELRYGLSWHGTSDGSLIFFKKNGGYFASLKNAENPVILSENVVCVTQDNTRKYINLSTGKTLFSQPTSFNLGNGITATTVHYEKFLGYQSDGTEHGWNVDFPEISGLPNATVQKTINDAIRSFFLTGPSVTAEYEALEGGYGASIEGSVLVVWANCVSGKGAGSSVWNNSLAFDLRTGKTYSPSDVIVNGRINTAKELLPDTYPLYLYSFPRLSAQGITFYYNEFESETRRAYTEDYLLTFDQLGDLVDRDSACYEALHTPYSADASINATVAGFSDVPLTHWAADYIREVSSRDLMHGASGKFRPDDTITEAEVCATISRSLSLESNGEIMQGLDPDAWYAEEVSAVWQAGLLDGLTDSFRPNHAISRADAMQLFANVLLQQGASLPDQAQTEKALASFTDASSIPENRRAAVALCVQKKLVAGYPDGTVRPAGNFTRAEFAKLLLFLAD